MDSTDIIDLSASRVSKWGECFTRALHDERNPGEDESGPEALVGSAGHKALEDALPVPVTGEKRAFEVESNFKAALIMDGRPVPREMVDEYAERLVDLSKRDDLWPAPHEILTVEASGIQRRHRIDDLHGKPGFRVIIGAIPGTKYTLALRGRMDLVAVRDSDPHACVNTDWGFAAEKAPIAAKIYAVVTSIMFPGFARYVTRQIYLMAGLRLIEQTYTAEQIPDLIREVLEFAAKIVAAREEGVTTATPNKRCGECRLSGACPEFQAALQPMTPPSEAVRWPTNLAELDTPAVLDVYQRFNVPRRAVADYWDAVNEELKTRLSGDDKRVVGADGHGVRLARDSNGFAYPNVQAYIAWLALYGLPLHRAVQPIPNEDLMRLVNGITDEPKRKEALEALDKIRNARAPKRVLRNVSPKGPKQFPEQSEAKEAA